MKNFTLPFFLIPKLGVIQSSIFVLFFLLFGVSSFGQIYLNNITTGRPINSFYLGDKLPSNTYYQFEMGQATWNASEAGIGQNSDGSTGWNWSGATYYEDGTVPNKRVQRDFNNFQFIATGTWYITGRAKTNSGDAWTYSDEGWNNNSVFSTGTSAYYSVNALAQPTTQTASANGASAINLSWAKWNSKDVMVVRSTDASFTAPTNGTTYTPGSSTIAGDLVVYRGSATTFTDTGLSGGTQYYYAFYSENGSYYSTSVTASATTSPPTAPVITATDAATLITAISAISGGNITSSGGNTITERGIVYSTVTAPDITDVADTKITVAGTTGTFTANLTGLSPLTTYYVRAYAKNGIGTSYGSQVTFISLIPTYSAKAFFKLNGASTVYYGAKLSTTCDPGQVSDLAVGGTPPVIGTLAQGQNFQLGGNLIQSGTVYTNARMYYKIFKRGTGKPDPAYSSIALANIGAPACNAADRKWEVSELLTTVVAGNNNLGQFEGDGTYFVQVYFSGVSGSTYDWYRSGTSAFTAQFNVTTPTVAVERDANDGNYNPTATNTSGMFESYMGVLVKDINGVPLSGLNRVFNMDGAIGSINSTNFDFGIQDPGLTFNVGTETKVFTKGTHKVCGCSSWSYVYNSALISDPVETDFPLPTAGSLFSSQVNGKFTLLNSSALINANQPFTTSGANASGSTSDGTYNGNLGSNITKYKDYSDPTVGTVSSINNPVNPILCPTCDGDYRVAIAMLSWVSTNNNCNDKSSLIYHRDINKNKVTTAGVVLNPNHNDASFDSPGNRSKNSLPGTSLFYVSKVKIGASDGTKKWDGTNWLTFSTSVITTPPTVKNNILFMANYSTTAGNIKCNNLEVKDGVIVTIEEDNYIEALNEVNTNATGKIIIKNTGNLVQRCDDKPSSARIEHKKTTGIKRKWDYVYWGSPITQNMFSSFPSPFDLGYRRQSGPGGGWKSLNATSTVGEGFILRIGNSSPWNDGSPGYITEWQINGTANNGIFSVPVSQENYASNPSNYNNAALLANPYPCALDGYKFLTDPNNLNLEGNLFFWTSATRYPGSGLYQDADYAIWNLTGTTVPANGQDPVDGTIPSGQGFFVRVMANGTAVFKDYMRSTDRNTMFFRKAKPKIDRYWLNITDGIRLNSQILVGYLERASNGVDRMYDARGMGVASIELYSLMEDEKFAINGRAPFTIEDEIPLGFKKLDNTPTLLTLTLTNKEGIFNDQTPIYLYDSTLNYYHNLQEGSYTFTTSKEEENNRFKVVYQNPVTLGINNFDASNAITFIKNHKLNVNSTENITKVEVYDVSGRIMATYNSKEISKSLSSDFNYSNGIYVAKIFLESGKTITQKLMN